jgi:hypothetical protein
MAIFFTIASSKIVKRVERNESHGQMRRLEKMCSLYSEKYSSYFGEFKDNIFIKTGMYHI